MASLTVVIPSRQEEWLNRTIEGLVTNMRGDTRVIAVLDGAWPIVGVPDHPNVHLIYHPESIGQRAATNEGVRVSTSDYVMKLDAHCAVDEGFDVKLMQPYEDGELERNVTTIPRMYNLHVFNWVCRQCKADVYQGPKPTVCKACAAEDPYDRVVVWQPRLNRLTDFARFDSEPHFQYASNHKHRPALQGDFPEVMSSVGACCFMRRDRWDEIGGLDESFGSWGSFGIEISCKSWLSGGRQVTNRRTWFSHLFRTQPGFGFPYHMPQKQADHAKRKSRDMWFNNKWPGQTRPLSWLIEHFWPVAGWSEPAYSKTWEEVKAAGAAFTLSRENSVTVGEVVVPLIDRIGGSISGGDTLSVLHGLANLASPMSLSSARIGRQRVTSEATRFAMVDSSDSVPTQTVLSGGNESQMDGIGASSVGAEVVELRDSSALSLRDGTDQPSKKESVGRNRVAPTYPELSGLAVTAPADTANPLPAPGLPIDPDLGKQAGNSLGSQMRGNCEILCDSHGSTSSVDAGLGAASCDEHDTAPGTIPQRGIVFISDSHAPPHILAACRSRVFRASEGIPIVSVTLEPIALGRNIVLSLTRSRLTMFKQYLAGLEASTADVVFLAEHDCFYPSDHFHFEPPRDDRFYYDQSVWRIDADTGRAITYDMMSVSGLCAYRPLLLDHYRKVVADVEANGHDHRRGYEPGIREGLAVGWRSAVPYVDIRHGMNLTASRWSPDEFRDKSTCQNWVEADEIPGWGKTKGRFDVWLQEQW